MNKQQKSILITSISAMMLSSGVAWAATFYASSNGGGDCGSWAGACGLAQAIDAASEGDVVLVHSGTYGPIVLKNGVKLFGGFVGTESSPGQGDPVANETIIDGGGQPAVVSADNASSTVVSGFIITNGRTESSDGGGGVKLSDSSVLFIRCTFRGNSASQVGGAMVIRGSGSPQFINCKFYDNGGISGGLDTAQGGGVYVENGTPSFVGCLFHNNSAKQGGAMFIAAGSPVLINCTLAQNHATDGDGGGINDSEGSSTVRNSILWGNTATGNGQQIFNSEGMDGTVMDSSVQGGWLGDSSVSVDPLFVSVSNRDFHLQAASLCRDHGKMNAMPPDVADVDFDNNVQEPIPKDLDFRLRVFGVEIDQGVYELQTSATGG